MSRTFSLIAVVASALAIRPAIAAEGAQPAPPASASLRWAPPALQQPKTIELTATSFVPQLDPKRDYIIKLPNEPRIKAVQITGGRNVVIIGGEIAMENLDGQDAYDSQKRAIYIKNNMGTVHIEGVLIDGSNSGEFDGVAIAAPESTVQLQNMRIMEVHGTYQTFHGDVVQPWGGVKELRIDRMTASTHYQGLQIDKDLQPIEEELIQNVNLTGPGNYKIWLTKFPDDNPKRVVFTEVYVTPRDGRPLEKSVWPESKDEKLGAKLAEDGKSVSWPNLPFVEGEVKLGPPPGGDFVPEGVAGLTYQSPGYRESDRPTP